MCIITCTVTVNKTLPCLRHFSYFPLAMTSGRAFPFYTPPPRLSSLSPYMNMVEKVVNIIFRNYVIISFPQTVARNCCTLRLRSSCVFNEHCLPYYDRCTNTERKHFNNQKQRLLHGSQWQNKTRQWQNKFSCARTNCPDTFTYQEVR